MPFKVIERDFATDLEARIWMITNQFGRRNIVDFVRGELSLELKDLLRELAEKNSKANLFQFQVTDNKDSTDWDKCPSRRNKTQAEYDKDRVNA